MQPKSIEVVSVAPPPGEQRVRRDARFPAPGEKPTRYTLPAALESPSPVGFRTRLALTPDQAAAALRLLALERPRGFGDPGPITEQALFEEAALGVLSSRQSTNFRGFRQVTLGPRLAPRAETLLRELAGTEAPPLTGSAYVHLVLGRPYRTPFTALLTLVGHQPGKSLITVPRRIVRKRLYHEDDIPTIGYLPHLHVGILADAMERAAIVASAGRRRAQAFMAPFCGEAARRNRRVIRELEALAGLSTGDRTHGWRLVLAAQVGGAVPGDEVPLDEAVARRLGASLLAFRSERIQPGVNAEEKAPPQYQKRQDMDVPDELTVMCGRAAYNAFGHWTGLDRERGKDLLLLDRVDVLTPDGKERLRAMRRQLEDITSRLIRELPKWADLPTGRMFSRNAARGKKAFALAGQRIYVGGLCRGEMEAAGLDWQRAVRAFGAAASRSALVAEIAGVTGLPDDCDLLAGVCLMAGPVNQNDIGKSFYGVPDLLADTFPGRDPTSLLVWTLKAKTVADPIGNEEQLLNAARKGALVDLRPGPHEVVEVERGGRLAPMRRDGERLNEERAFADLDNFVADPDGREIAGNRGRPWPHRDRPAW
jgi:hypothetical protein